MRQKSQIIDYQIIEVIKEKDTILKSAEQTSVSTDNNKSTTNNTANTHSKSEYTLGKFKQGGNNYVQYNSVFNQDKNPLLLLRMNHVP